MPGGHGRKRELDPRLGEGFTLLETIVVIVIIGIIAVTAAPRMLSMSDLAAAQAHRKALADLRFARRLGASSGCPVRVDFSASGYTLDQRASCRTGAFGAPIADPETNRSPFVATMPSGVAITSDLDPMIFDELGRVTNDAGTVFDATVSVGGRTISAVGETGLVRAL